jgi:hypothetical protein
MGTLSLQGGIWVFGADSSGTSITPLTYQTINPTSGFTLLEPDTARMEFSSVSHAAGTGITTFTLNGTTTNASDQRFAGSGVTKWPRYYQALTDADGNALDTDDSFMMLVKLSDFTHPSSLGYGIGVGLCLDPTATDSNTFDGWGITTLLASTTSQRKGGITSQYLSTGQESSYGGSDADTVFGTLHRSAVRFPGASVFGESSGASIANGGTTVSAVSTAFSTGQAWNLWVGVVVRNSGQVIPSGESFACKISYQIIKVR